MTVDDREAHGFYADPANLAGSGPGRKRKGQAGRLENVTPIRFTSEVIGAVKDRAFAEGITVGAWIRRLVLRELGRARPEGVIAMAAGQPRVLPSSLWQPRTFSCPHLSVSGVTSAACETCGPLEAAA